MRRVLTGAMAVLLAGAVVVHRSELAQATRQLGRLEFVDVITLAALAVVATVLNGMVAVAVCDRLSIAQGVAVQQASLAANNTAVGSGPIALAVRVAMLRSWGLDHVGIPLAVIAVDLVATVRLWSSAAVVSILGLTGVGSRGIERWMFVAALAGSIAVFGGASIGAWLVVRRPRMVHRLASIVERLLGAVACRSRRVGAVAERVDVHRWFDRLRAEAISLGRARWRRVSAIAASEQAVLLLLPIAVVRAFGVDRSVVSVGEVLATFVLVRLGAALTAVPGGIGVTELGVTTLLRRFGVPESPVIAIVLTYRAITFLLPIGVGGVCFALWRRRTPPTERDRAAPVGAARWLGGRGRRQLTRSG